MRKDVLFRPAGEIETHAGGQELEAGPGEIEPVLALQPLIERAHDVVEIEDVRGGMCHYMLPGRSLEGELNARYGEDALQLLVAEIRQQGTAVTDYEAKLFGGASMFDVGPHGSSVARRNVEAAEALMLRHGVTVIARSLGGTGYRRLFFNIADGDVWVSRGESRAEPVGPVSSGGAA